MKKLYRRLIDYFYSTFLGGWYLEYLLLKDSKESKQKYLTPKEMAQIIRESSKMAEGTLAIKKKVNALVNSTTKEEYDRVLSEIEDLVSLSEYDDKDSSRHKYVQFLKNVGDTKKVVDVENALDRAKMIDKKIDAIYELQEYNLKRQMAKDIKRLVSEGKTEEANKLKEEFKKKYGR